MSKTNNLKDLVEEMKKANADARKFLLSIDKKIAEIDIEYAQLLVKEDIDTLKTARDIILKRSKK